MLRVSQVAQALKMLNGEVKMSLSSCKVTHLVGWLSVIQVMHTYSFLMIKVESK